MTAAGPLPTCRCGHDRSHHMVSKDRKYTLWGSIWVTLFGVSTVPIRIEYRCRRCGKVFDQTTDPEELENYL
jgi:hypothetical protein